ncbi:DUF3784 domain-containing protein [Sporosarcina sp. GW1-11]|uniref:DUF3784 domain-containing protein n=1 Tax=Sporosarcina sp. GW1-11 TaxID=2899126 RepID=UPI00294EAA10|nr:DUF3784 domain-containing protein [Sporosarcina sp. GW1-11]MDV6377970.1 DUF3784 domain-containing protein [Sporosarcina sp. GW1-11]
MLGLLINVAMMIVFIVYGAMLSQGKGASLLSGYNTMSLEKKAKIDEFALCKFMAKIMYALAFCLGLFALSEWLEQDMLFIVGLALFFVVIMFAIVYSNTGNRFAK